MKKSLIPAICVFLFCCILYTQASKLPPPRFEALGPAFLPKLVIGVIAALCILDMLVIIIKANRKISAQKEAEAVTEPKPGPLYSIVLPVVSVAYFVIYILIVEYTDISYLLLTFLYLVIAMWTLAMFKPKALPAVLATAIGISAFIYIVFHVCLEIILP